MAVPLLVVLYAIVQSWVLAHAVCPARDGERYLGFALRLESESWHDVLATSIDHPGYPLAIRGAFAVADAFGPSTPADRAFQAQLTSSACGLIYLLAAYALLRVAFDARLALVGSLALVCLPRPQWLFADILSDPAFSAAWMASAAAMARAFRRRSLSMAAIGGLFGAMAYLVRVDALTLIALFGAVLGAALLGRVARQPLPGAPGGSVGRVFGTGLAFGLVFATGPLAFLVVYGRVSPKPIANVLLNALRLDAPGIPLRGVLGSALPLAEILPPAERFVADSALEYFKVLGQQLQFYHLGAAIITLVLLCALGRWRFGTLLAFAVTMLYLLVFVTLRLKVGYADGRYLLVVLPFVIGFGLTGVEILGELLVRALRGRSWASGIARGLPWLALAASLAFSIPSLASRSIRDREANVLAAGAWCSEHMSPSDTVHDPYFYPSFLHGLRVRDSIEPKGEASGVAYAITREESGAVDEPIASLVTAGRAQLEARFEGGDAGRRRPAASVYRILPAGSANAMPR